MPASPDAPAPSPVALLLVDVINDLEFEGGEDLLPHAACIAEPLARLAGRARAAGVPVIYVNDNFTRWRDDFDATLERALQPGTRGRAFAERLRPQPDDFYILKPKFSGFFGTSLDVLLEHIGARTLVVTGLATDVCVLFTVGDAYMRGFRLIVPRDGCAAEHAERHEAVLAYAREVLDVETPVADDVDWAALLREAEAPEA